MRGLIVATLLAIVAGLAIPVSSPAGPLNIGHLREAAQESSLLQQVQVCNRTVDWCRGEWRWRCQCSGSGRNLRCLGWTVVSYTSCKGKKQGYQ
jgi:hypothetical protein